MSYTKFHPFEHGDTLTTFISLLYIDLTLLQSQLKKGFPLATYNTAFNLQVQPLKKTHSTILLQPVLFCLSPQMKMMLMLMIVMIQLKSI